MTRTLLLSSLVALFAACGSSPVATGYVIQAESGQTLQATAGDALRLIVKETLVDGTLQSLPSSAVVTWATPSTVTALSADSTAASPMPSFGGQPTAIFIDSPDRPDHATDLTGVLFVLDLGTPAGTSVTVTAMVSGVTPGGPVTATVALTAAPTGNATRGAALFVAGGANCARCHGPTGHGTDLNPDGGAYEPDAGTYLIAEMSYPFPAPGINAEDGNLGSDPAWNAALLAMSARADMDNEGVTLRLPMVNWLTTPLSSGALLTTQDFADIYAFLQTQMQ